MNPLNFGFSALMEVEFSRINLECTGESIVPRNTATVNIYPDSLGENQVCTLAGSTAGQAFVPGRDYISAAFDYQVKDIWRNFAILIIFFLGFTFLQAFSLEYFKHGSDRPGITVFLKENKERKKLNEALAEKRQRIKDGKGDDSTMADKIQSKKPFTWENLTYDVPVAGGQRRLLDNVFGYVKPGTLTALMGASGAGASILNHTNVAQGCRQNNAA
jgi:ATP-binding cassette subfamily G (WHITE) protein 2 (SNQ2)